MVAPPPQGYTEAELKALREEYVLAGKPIPDWLKETGWTEEQKEQQRENFRRQGIPLPDYLK